MKTIRSTALLALAVGAACSAGVTTTVQYHLITGPNNLRALSANDMSPDGRYVVGAYDDNGDPLPDGNYLWDTVLNTFTILPADGIDAVGVSDDGTVVVGDVLDPNYNFAETAGRWTALTGWQSLGALPNAGMCPSVSNSYEVSADGSVVVGLSWDGCSGRGFIWTQANGMQELESLANGSNRASVVSSDGATIAGFAQGTFNRTPASWDGPTLDGELISPPYNGDAEGEVHGLSDDGSVLLGTQYLGAGDFAYDAVKWVNGGAPQPIGAGSLLTGWAGHAMDISSDGTIVGFDFLQGNRRAWIQPEGAGNLQLLHFWANQRGAGIPANVNLEVCQAISADGRFIIGHGATTGAWRIVITRTGCPGDANGDGVVDFDDLNIVLGNYNMTGQGLPGDFDNDNDVDFADLNTVLGAYNQPC